MHFADRPGSLNQFVDWFRYEHSRKDGNAQGGEDNLNKRHQHGTLLHQTHFLIHTAQAEGNVEHAENFLAFRMGMAPRLAARLLIVDWRDHGKLPVPIAILDDARTGKGIHANERLRRRMAERAGFRLLVDMVGLVWRRREHDPPFAVINADAIDPLF